MHQVTRHGQFLAVGSLDQAVKVDKKNLLPQMHHNG